MSPSGALMVVLGVFVVARTLFTDSHGKTLAGMLAGQPVPFGSTSSTGEGPYTPSTASGLAADTHSVGFAQDILKSIGAPANGPNVDSLLGWMAAEGNLPAVDQFNPLDTTQLEPGSHGTNADNVQSYTTWASGVDATARTLENGRYNSILASLRAGTGVQPSDPNQASELTTWGTGADW